MQKTEINWTELTWGTASGCTKISAGCKHCYAERIAEQKRGTPAFPNGFDVTLRPHKMGEPRSPPPEGDDAPRNTVHRVIVASRIAIPVRQARQRDPLIRRLHGYRAVSVRFTSPHFCSPALLRPHHDLWLAGRWSDWPDWPSWVRTVVRSRPGGPRTS